MKIKVKNCDSLRRSKKCYWFKRGEDVFFLPVKFVKKAKHNTFFIFPAWATQIYIKHENKNYGIFLADFEAFYTNDIPIPFENHFPVEPKHKPVLRTKKTYKVVEIQETPLISNYKQPVQPFNAVDTTQPTHDEMVMARRNGEIE